MMRQVLSAVGSPVAAVAEALLGNSQGIARTRSITILKIVLIICILEGTAIVAGISLAMIGGLI